MSRTRCFETEEAFKNKFLEYIDYCKANKQLANIAGFAVFCDINRDSFYQQKEYYPETFGKVQDILEDFTINVDINHILKMFYLKCKFDYKDWREIDYKSNNRITIVDDLDDTEN